jgi:hypothetical protein
LNPIKDIKNTMKYCTMPDTYSRPPEGVYRTFGCYLPSTLLAAAGCTVATLLPGAIENGTLLFHQLVNIALNR